MTLVVPSSPFKGLAAFDDSDLDTLLFFGREREIEVVAANLQASRLTVLYGPTGVGKSSILRAGVAQRLRAEANSAVEIVDRWAVAPVDAIRTAIARRPDAFDLYLMLDQFEEYFLYHAEDLELPRLLAGVVVDPGSRVNVLIGVRQDTLAQLDAFRRVLPSLLSNRLRLDRLDRPAARDACVRPVARYADLTGQNVEIESELVEQILDDVTAGRVDLAGAGRGRVNGARSDRIEAPYLQLVLQSIWDNEQASGSRVMRTATLQRLGGAERIVRNHVEQAMAELTPDEKRAAAAMYNHLVTPSGTKIAHRVGDLAGYASLPQSQASGVLDKLARERIVRASSENGPATVRYEIFHDVLADAVLAWRARHEEQEALHDAEQRRRRAQFVAVAALVGLILVGAIAVFALVERGNAESQARRAHAEALAASSLTQLGIDPSASLRLANDAARLRPAAREESVLRTALSADRLRRILRAHGPVSGVAYDSSGGHWIVGSADGNVRVYRPGSSQPDRVFRQGAAVTAAAIAPDGRLVIAAGRDGSLRTWDVESGKRIRAVSLHEDVRTVALIARRREVLAATNSVIAIWRVRDGRRIALIPVHTDKALVKVVVSPDGRQGVALYRFRRARVYALPSGRLLHSLAHDGFIEDVAYSPDGHLIATSGYAGDAGVVRLWDTGSGRLVRELRGALRHVDDVAFSKDGKLVGGGSADGTARVWETKTGTQIAIMIGHENQVTSVDFNPSGTALVSASSDGTARVWGATGGHVGHQLSVLAGHVAPVVAAVFAPDGRSVLTGSEDGTARVWDPGSEPPLTLLARSPRPLTRLAVRDAGRRIVVRQDDGTVDVRTLDGRLIRTGVRAPTAGLRAISPNGDVGALALSNGTIQLFDPRTNRVEQVLRGHKDAVNSVEFSPDGKLLVSASDDRDGRIWDVQTGAVVQKLHGHFGPVRDAAFSPDGRWVATAGPFSVGLWLVRGGAKPLLLDAPVERPVSAVAFAGSDGRTVIATSLDGTLRSYHCDICGNVDELLPLARRRLALER